MEHQEDFSPKVYAIAGSGEVFIQTRYTRGLYIKTHVSVSEVPCPVCGAQRCEPCTGDRGFWHAETHVKRREAWQKKKGSDKARRLGKAGIR